MHEAALLDDRTNKTQRGYRFPLAPFDAIKPDARAAYLVKGLLPREGLAVVWGQPKCGKSFLVSDLLLHVALGWEYRGHRVTQGAVVYCALEGAHGFRNRIEAFRAAKLAENGDASPPFFLMAASLSLAADRKRLIDDIKLQLSDSKPVVVCIDTLNRSIAGSENDDETMSAYVRAADDIRAAFGCLVIIVHHCGHGGDRPRGHSSLMGALDVQISVKRDPAENIVAELELAKDGAIGLQFISRLNVVEVGRDQDGDPVTSCVVESVTGNAAVTTAAKPGRSAQVVAIKRAVLTAYDNLSSKVAPSPGFDDAPVRKVSIEAIRKEVQSRGYLDTKEETGALTTQARQHFFKAKTDILAGKTHVEADGMFWKIARDTKPVTYGVL